MVQLIIYDYNIDEDGVVVETDDKFIPRLSSATVIGLSQDVLDLTDVSKQSAEFSYSFVFPSDEATLRFFRNFGTLNYVGRSNYISYRAELQKDGQALFSGRFVLQAYDQNRAEYRGQLFGDLAYIIYLLKDKKVRDLEYLKQFSHSYVDVTDTIYRSWTGECKRGFGTSPDDFVNPNLEFFYPLVDMQGMGYYHNENIQDDGSRKYVPFHTPIASESGGDILHTGFNGGELPVAVKLLPVIENILSEAGLIADTSYFHQAPQNNKWENAFMLLPKLKQDDKFKAKPLTEATNSANIDMKDKIIGTSSAVRHHRVKYDSWSVPIFTRDGIFVAPADGDYKFRVFSHIDIYTNLKVIQAETSIYVNGSKVHDLNVFTGAGEHWSPIPTPDTNAITLSEGDEVEVNVKITSAMPPIVNYVAGLTYLKDSYFYVTDGPEVDSYGRRDIGEYFGDTTQLDLVKEFMQLSKSVIDHTTPGDERSVVVKPILKLWEDNDAPQMDITGRIDRSNKFEVRPATELMPRTIGFEWKEGKDLLSESFVGKVGRPYGSTDKIGTGMMYAGKEMVVQSKLFAPFPTGAINKFVGTDPFSDIIVFRGFKDVEKFDTALDSYRLFLWDGVPRVSTYGIIVDGIKSAVNDTITTRKYPMCHNMLLTAADNYQVKAHTEDINWEWSVPYSVDSAEQMPDRGTQLYDSYYRQFIEALYINDTVIVDTSVYLTSAEFKNLNKWAPVMLDGSRYRILSYKDYDVMGDKPMKILLLKDNIGGLIPPPQPPIVQPPPPTGLFALAQCVNYNTLGVTYQWDEVPGATYLLTTDQITNEVVNGTSYTEHRSNLPSATYEWKLRYVKAGETSQEATKSITVIDAGTC